jgi:hypothetical protein
LQALYKSVESCFGVSISGNVLQFFRYLSEEQVLLSTQATTQGAVNQARATQRNKEVTFVVDTACQGTRAILEEVKFLAML